MKDEIETKYKYKLNMLEPGSFMCKSIALLAAVAFALYLFRVYKIALITICLAGVILLILVFLIIVEQHQDHMLYLEAKKKDSNIK